jgi:CBS domain-containing protein
VDGESRFLGVLTDRAVAAAWAHDFSSLSAWTTRSVLPAVPPVVGPEARVLDVAHLMRAGGVDAVVVVDVRRKPMGIVTGSDLVALLARSARS